ncbi:hypothetical protein BDV23DRAFT_157791 [Aspergillus alliaceus]|uniref:Uncharacterized protein n=1 Tax=Petromyces alliaceus TaxID=209559 RepID=A0A5N7C4T0_PETAA|nr:hypothetical protein BDV23DRAFT_157791 [Aspergillus alliaceus]
MPTWCHILCTGCCTGRNGSRCLQQLFNRSNRCCPCLTEICTPPFSAQKRSGFSSAFALAMVPSASTIFQISTKSSYQGQGHLNLKILDIICSKVILA